MYPAILKQALPILAILLLPLYEAIAMTPKESTLPGIVLPTELTQKLLNHYREKGSGYIPRTEHLHDDGSPHYTNRLILQDSPYLLQHAHNPVNWYPWGEEALAVAQRENKPIFLSIGYSTCHWCHVMERESFEDLAIAEYLNNNFIAIKVDREQRPDLDASYMMAVMLITGSGGWPMSTFLTTDAKPFYGGTYFPPENFLELLRRINQLWHEQPSELIAQGELVATEVAEFSAIKGEAGKLDDAVFAEAANSLMESYDELQGGFGSAPKFPNETMLLMLMQRVERFGLQNSRDAMNALIHTLDAMYQGGIHDHIGGGFHRYSIDDEWLVPHFEKMLYNQALLARTYLKGWQLSGLTRHATVARNTLDYVLRDMRSDQGAFYSATDADSEGDEGKFFVWDREELHQLLPDQLAKRAIDLFNITANGNFESSNILHLPQRPAEYARENKIELNILLSEIEQIRELLYAAREKRPHPARDEKIVSAWNGMMITTFALAGQQLAEPRYIDAATTAGEFIWRNNRPSRGRLNRVHLNGKSSVAASQEDYAWLGEAMVTLYDVTQDMKWLARARELADGMVELFHDSSQGGFYMSSTDVVVSGIGRTKDLDDGAIPSGNSMALRLLSLLANRTEELRYAELADKTIAAFATTVKQSPLNYSWFLLAGEEHLKSETGSLLYAGQGTVRVKATAFLPKRVGDDWELSLTLKMKDGWHVNAHIPKQKYLIGTTIGMAEKSGWKLEQVSYPSAVTRTLGFSREALDLYENEVTITARLKHQGDAPLHIPLTLNVQSCSDKICLAPEKLSLAISTASE